MLSFCLEDRGTTDDIPSGSEVRDDGGEDLVEDGLMLEAGGATRRRSGDWLLWERASVATLDDEAGEAFRVLVILLVELRRGVVGRSTCLRFGDECAE